MHGFERALHDAVEDVGGARVMISVGTVSLEVKMPLKAPRIAPRAAAIRKGTMIEPFHPLSTSTRVVT